MPRKRKPRAGSLKYWPRKKASRIYPALRSSGTRDSAGPLGFAAFKAGMTHATVGGKSRAVTVLDAPSLFVCGIRFYSHSPTRAAGEKWGQMPKDLEIERKARPSKKNAPKDYDDLRLIIATQPKKSGLSKRKPDLFEMPLHGNKEEKTKYAESVLGKELAASDVFKDGERVTASAVTKGHGFTGPVKRFGIKIQTRKNEQHHRHVGSIGGVVPRKVDWRVPAAGQHGFHRRTEYSKRILSTGASTEDVTPKGGFVGYGEVNDYIIIEGSVPGPRKRLIMLSKSDRARRDKPEDIQFISRSSKQGR